MSKYTTEVRYICESLAGLEESVGLSGVDSVIERARGKVFDFAYPIFDEEYRGVLETKILKHFYTREIGAETVGLWKLWLNTRLNEIMPYYNKLYKSELLEFNPLYDFEVTREHKGTRKGTKEDNGERTENRTETRDTTGNGSANATITNSENETITNSENGTNKNTHYDYYSDTPQGGVGNLETLEYLTNARKISDNGENSNTLNGSSTNTLTGENTNTNEYSEDIAVAGEISGTSKMSSVINNTEDYLETVKGKQSGISYSKMLEEYRTTFLNIDMQVINELNDLFMNLW